MTEAAATPLRRRGRCFVPCLAGFEPRGPRAVVLPKRRYGAFFATDLALFQHEQKVSMVGIASVKTNVYIRPTAQDAFASGLDLIVPREAATSTGPNSRPHRWRISTVVSAR